MPGGPPAQIRVRVPSKVNLFLAVRGRRDDGYHELVTVLQTVSIHDTLTAVTDGSAAALHPSSRRFMDVALSLEGLSSVPGGEENIAVRAARELMAELGVGGQGRDGGPHTATTRLHLTKRIPVAAGMAGGSADAAAVLIALNDLWDAGLGRDELRSIAARLGADVPFCVTGGTALATGVGTATAQVLTRGTAYWVVGISHEPLSTPDVYRAFDEVAAPSDREPDAVLQALRSGDVEALGAALHNDLEPAALSLRPELAGKLEAMRRAGALGALVSGSGPTLVALAPDARSSVVIAEAVRDEFDRVEVAMSPAGGPEVSET